MPQTNIHDTRGVVLHQIKYSESSIITKIYTEAFGIQSFLVRGVRKKGSKIKAGLFQTLSLVDLVVYFKEKSNIQNLKEIKSALPQTSIPFNIKKSTIAIFLNEILYKTLKEVEPNPALFTFIFESVKYLDKAEANYNDFHLFFMIRLSKYLGFFPKENYSQQNIFFDLTEGLFIDHHPAHLHYIENPLSYYLSEYLKRDIDELVNNKLPPALRKEMLVKLLDYYKIHIEGFGNLKSYPILKSILNPA